MIKNMQKQQKIRAKVEVIKIVNIYNAEKTKRWC